MCRLMKETSNAVLDAFRPIPAPSNPQRTTTHQDELHSTALIKLSQGSCILQHHALKFVSSLLLAEPGTLEHLKAEGLWELAYGNTFFFWNARHGSSHTAPGEFFEFHRLHCIHVDSSCNLVLQHMLHLQCICIGLLHVLFVHNRSHD